MVFMHFWNRVPGTCTLDSGGQPLLGLGLVLSSWARDEKLIVFAEVGSNVAKRTILLHPYHDGRCPTVQVVDDASISANNVVNDSRADIKGTSSAEPFWKNAEKY